VKIVILGAGQVGSSVAENLASEANDITIVDTNAERLSALQDKLDVRTVCGNAAHPAILEQAGRPAVRGDAKRRDQYGGVQARLHPV